MRSFYNRTVVVDMRIYTHMYHHQIVFNDTLSDILAINKAKSNGDIKVPFGTPLVTVIADQTF